MSLRIEWTRIALQSLSDVFDYTFEVFGEQQLEKMRTQIHETARIIATFPQAGKTEALLTEALGSEYRSMVVIKEIKLIYTITADAVFIEYVKNNRQDDSTIITRMNPRNLNGT